jgi:hypothetical protein
VCYFEHDHNERSEFREYFMILEENLSAARNLIVVMPKAIRKYDRFVA